MIITSNSIILLKTQKEVQKNRHFPLKNNKAIRDLNELAGKPFLLQIEWTFVFMN